MKILFIGKFKKLHDEEYIARSFEMLGHEVYRCDERNHIGYVKEMLDASAPDIVLWIKLNSPDAQAIRALTRGYKTVCWVFDLYFGYTRQARLGTTAFTADFVATTDGGHNQDFARMGINHHCVRQGIWKDECFIFQARVIPQEYDVIFVGSHNPSNKDRSRQLEFVSNRFKFTWFGKQDTDEIRGTELNELYAKSKIVIGDSVYSPYYWSNRVVETLGRGGFLIHREVPGIKEEYPYLVTYDGTMEDLDAKIRYYLIHKEERREIMKKNYEWVRDHYTMDKKCAELFEWIK